ncbi:MAG: CHAT domain-containing protein [Calditrichaeota bacterium]|nr:CHAT domain-containing protein [Calditrichota bacterium]
MAVLWASTAVSQEAGLSSYYEKLFSPRLEGLQHLTTHPKNDIFPSLSPRGKWLVFASDRNQNYDIWAKNTQTGDLFQLTTHKSEDTQPVWFPNGKQIVFISKRSDGLGDLYLLSVRLFRGYLLSKKTTQLNDYLGYDGEPAVSPDGKWVAFVSDRQTGRKNIWLLRMKTRKVFQVTTNGGFSPAFSPGGRWLTFTKFSKGRWQIVRIPFSPEEFPVSPEKESVVFSSGNPSGFSAWSDSSHILVVTYPYDTNGDGKKTVSDHGVLVECSSTPPKDGHFDEANLPVFKTSGIWGSYFPVWGKTGKILFSSDFEGNKDIWAMEPFGEIRIPDTPWAISAFAEQKFPLQPVRYFQVLNDSSFQTVWRRARKTYLLQRLFVLRKGLQRAQGSPDFFSQFAFKMGETAEKLGWNNLADTYYSRAIQDGATQTPWALRAQLALWRLGTLHPAAEMVEIDSLLSQTIRDKTSRALLYLEQARLFRKLGKYNQSLERLQSVLNEKAIAVDVIFRAGLMLGEIYTELQNFQLAVKTEAALLRLHPDAFYWNQVVLQKIKWILSQNPEWSDPVQEYQFFIQTYSDIPQLAAWAQYEIGYTYEKQGDFRVAIREFVRTRTHYSTEREAYFRATVGLIAINHFMKDSQALIRVCRETLQKGTLLDSTQVWWVRQNLVRALLNKGEKLLSQNDWQLARSAFQSVLATDSLNVEAHRGIVKCADRGNQLAAVIGHYREKILKSPENDVYLYTLGLAYSYLATRQERLSEEYRLLRLSNRYLENALKRNYRLVYAYLTLGFNYETLAGLERMLKNQKEPLVSRITKGVLAPVFWAVRTLTFQKAPAQHLWYEKAIDLLTVGVSINNEKKNPTLEAQLTLNLANNYYQMGEFGFEKAFHYYRIRMQLDSTFRSVQQEALVYERMGHCAIILENWPEAVKDISKAISLYRQQKNTPKILENTDRLAWAYFMSGEYDLAVENYLDILRTVRTLQNLPEKERTLERLHRNLANAYLYLHDFRSSLKHLQIALNLLDSGKIKDKHSLKGYLRIEFLGYSIPVFNINKLLEQGGSKGVLTVADERALLYTLLKKNYVEQKYLLQAIRVLEEKRRLFHQKKDHLAEAVTENNLGFLYSFYGDYESAWKKFSRSFSICRDRKYWSGAVINLNNIARLTLAFWTKEKLTGETPQTITVDYKRVLALLMTGRSYLENIPYGMAKERVALLYQTGILKTLLYLLPLRTQQDTSSVRTIQRYAAATDVLQIYGRALDWAARLHLMREQIILRKNRADIYLFLGWPDEARADLQAARQLALQTGASNLLWRIDFAMSTLSQPGERPLAPDSTAFRLLEEAVQILETTPDTTGGRQFIGEPRLDQELVYETYLNKEARAGRVKKALEISERREEKWFLDDLSGYRLKLKLESHKIFYGNARYLLLEIARQKNSLRELSARKIPDIKRQSRIKAHLDSLQTEYTQMIRQYLQTEPELVALVQPVTIPVKKIQAILKPRTALIRYDLGLKDSWAWMVTRDTVLQAALPVSKAEVVSRAKKALAMKGVCAEPDSNFHWLSQNLIDPLLKQGQPFSRLIFVPDRSLLEFPFGRLPYKNGCLSDSVSIQYAADLMSFYFQFQKRHIPQKKIAFVSPGKAVFDFSVPSKATLVRDVRRSATELNLRKVVQDADIIHLKVPLLTDRFQPMRMAFGLRYPNVKWRKMSTLISPFPPNNDGRLHMHEVFGLDSRANVLILERDPSQGQTPIPSSDLMTLVHAFTYAGVPSFIFQMHTLPEKARRLFFNEFYKHVFTERPFDAFEMAQKKVRQVFPDPDVWDAYRWFGFEGMSPGEEVQFAKSRLNRMFAMGYRFAQKGYWWDAIRNYEQALRMAKLLKQTAKVVILYQQLVEASANGKYWPRAAHYQELLNRFYENQKDWESLLEGTHAALVFYSHLHNRKKMAFYQKKYEKLLAQLGTHAEQAQAFRQIALLQERNKNYSEALSFLKKALRIYQKLGKPAESAQILLDLSRIHLKYLDAYSQAIAYAEKSLSLVKNEPPAKIHMRIYQYLGLAYEKIGSYQTSLDFQMKAAALSRNLGNLSDQGLEHQFLANIYWKMGDYLHALKEQEKAIEIFQKLKDPRLLKLAYSTKGLIFMSLNEIPKGLSLEMQALALARSLGDSLDEATILKNIGNGYARQANWDSARTAYRQAIKIDSLISAKRGLGYDFRNLGLFFLQEKKNKAALGYMKRALAMSRRIRDRRNEASCLLGLGRIYHQMGRVDSALAYGKEAVRLAQQLEIPEITWQAFEFLGDTWTQRDSLQKGLQAYEKAIDVIEKQRAQIRVESFQTGFLADKMGVYGKVINLLVRQHKPRKSFEFAERAKSRSFIDMLGNRKINFREGADSTALKQGNHIQNTIQRWQNILAQVYQTPEMTPALKDSISRIRATLDRLRARYRDFLDRLRMDNPELASMVSVEPFRVGDIQRSLDDSTALLAYYVLPKKLILWTLRKDTIAVSSVPISSKKLINLVRMFRADLQKKLPIDDQARRLYRILIRPAGNFLKPCSQLILVPHGVLHYLPFGALMDGKGRYVLERFRLANAPSATVLKFCLQKGDHFQKTKGVIRKVLAVGDPDLGNPRYDLPFAEKEAESLKRTFSETTVLLRKRATETRVKRIIGEYDLDLFSTHGEYDPVNPLFSALRLTPDSLNDGRLEAWEIFGLRMNAFLVTMSACETGLGKITRGDEVIGLSRSFIFAGTPAVVASLWKVDDLTTAVIMKRFHRYLHQGLSRAQALKEAQNYVRQYIHPYPYFWAAFYLTGDPR